MLYSPELGQESPLTTGCSVVKADNSSEVSGSTVMGCNGAFPGGAVTWTGGRVVWGPWGICLGAKPTARGTKLKATGSPSSVLSVTFIAVAPMLTTVVGLRSVALVALLPLYLLLCSCCPCRCLLFWFLFVLLLLPLLLLSCCCCCGCGCCCCSHRQRSCCCFHCVWKCCGCCCPYSSCHCLAVPICIVVVADFCVSRCCHCAVDGSLAQLLLLQASTSFRDLISLGWCFLLPWCFVSIGSKTEILHVDSLSNTTLMQFMQLSC